MNSSKLKSRPFRLLRLTEYNDLITIKQAAEIYGCGYDNINGFILRRTIRCYVWEGKILLRRSEVERKRDSTLSRGISRKSVTDKVKKLRSLDIPTPAIEV